MTKLIIEKYPSKATWNAEATRDDTPSYPFLHIEYYSPTLSTIDLFNILRRFYVGKNDLGNASLHEKGDYVEIPNVWLTPQIDIWKNEVDKVSYRAEIVLARELFKHVNRKRFPITELKDLIIRIRIEFHD